MEVANHDAAISVGETEPGWAEVVDRVICDGRPGFLRDAADRYEHLLRRMHDEATSMEDELGNLAQSWDGAAFAAYHAAIQAVMADLRQTAVQARAIVDALRLAADVLRAHQERIPIPVKLRGEIFRAHQQRRDLAGGLAPSNEDFKRAVHADVVESEPWLTAAEAVEQARIVFEEQQNVARGVYAELSAAYRDVEALLPALTGASVIVATGQPAPKRHSTGRAWSKVDMNLGHAVEGVEDEDEVVAPIEVAEVIGLAETEIVPVPVYASLGAHDVDDDSRRGGNLSGSGTGTMLGPGLNDTGAAFGVPVSVMGTPGVSSGLPTGMGISPGMGSGLHPSPPMTAGFGGGVIGGGVESNTNSTWLNAEDNPFEQDGESSGAVLS